MVFSFLICFTLFISGIYATDAVMKKKLLLGSQNNILLFSKTGQALKDVRGGTTVKAIDNLLDKAEEALTDIKDFLYKCLDEVSSRLYGFHS